MFNKIYQPFRVLIALILLNGSRVQGETDQKPPNPAPTLSISDIVSDLQKRGKAISIELDSIHPDSKGKPEEPEARKKSNAKMMESSEIHRCLVYRGSVTKTMVIPTDPYYRVFRKRMLTEVDLQTVQVWWKYCREDSEYKSLSRLEELPLVVELKSAQERAGKEMSSLSPARAVAKSGTMPASRNPSLSRAIANRLGADKERNGSVLDQIGDWNKLSAEKKSQFIAH